MITVLTIQAADTIDNIIFSAKFPWYLGMELELYELHPRRY